MSHVSIGGEQALGDELLTVDTTVGGKPFVSVPNYTKHCYLQNQGSVDVYCRPKVAGAPTTSNGLKIAAGDGFDYTGDPGQLKFICSSSSTIYALYFG